MNIFKKEIVEQTTIKRKYLYLIIIMFIVCIWWLNNIGAIEAFIEGFIEGYNKI